jgi:hypothetical protein
MDIFIYFVNNINNIMRKITKIIKLSKKQYTTTVPLEIIQGLNEKHTHRVVWNYADKKKVTAMIVRVE